MLASWIGARPELRELLTYKILNRSCVSGFGCPLLCHS